MQMTRKATGNFPEGGISYFHEKSEKSEKSSETTFDIYIEMLLIVVGCCLLVVGCWLVVGWVVGAFYDLDEWVQPR